ncbi:MAG: ABC transporter ATP-binding protein [Erysipelotrichaceae bacterium]|nr:ABC transporter ATP-binding protein [Erysipelotrichaceae bacterium]
MIELQNVFKRLGGLTVLDDFNVTIKDKTVFGLIGTNGAGKSTMLRCIAGVYEVDSGKVTIDGLDIKNNDIIKKNMFFVGDDCYYPINSTINSLKEFYKTFYNFDEVKYEKYLKILNLDPNKLINNFSKGMKRQVFLLIAISLDIKVLILDESFDGLDPYVRLIFKKEIATLVEEKDITVIISSHNLRELEDICDTFAIIENKKIIVSGDIDFSKNSINKFQVVFNEDLDINSFKDLDIFHFNKIGRVITIVCKGDIEYIKKYINDKNPIFMEILPINFEELFIYEIEKRR